MDADEEKETNAQAVAACLKTGFVRHFEITYVDNIGNRTPVEINATVMEEAGKKRILTLCRDITERKLAEKSIRESEEKYRACLKEARMASYPSILKPDGLRMPTQPFAECLDIRRWSWGGWA